MDHPIRIVVADDHPLMRNGLSLMLARAPDLIVVGEASDGHQVQQRCEQLQPDVLLLDLYMTGPPPEAILDHLKRVCPRLKVLIFTAYADEADLARLVGWEIDGYLLKEEPITRLVEAIRTVMAGGSWFSQTVTGRLLAMARSKAAAVPEPVLTPRQRQILDLLLQGLSNDQIALKLKLSVWTVQEHLGHLYARLGVRNQRGAIAWAIRRHRPRE